MPEEQHTSRGRVTKPKRTRVNFTPKQLETMEKVFSQTQYPDVTVLEMLASRMDLGIEKVCTWFQNRRSKFRRESKRGHIDWMREQLFDGRKTSDRNGDGSADLCTNHVLSDEKRDVLSKHSAPMTERTTCIRMEDLAAPQSAPSADCFSTSKADYMATGYQRFPYHAASAAASDLCSFPGSGTHSPAPATTWTCVQNEEPTPGPSTDYSGAYVQPMPIMAAHSMSPYMAATQASNHYDMRLYNMPTQAFHYPDQMLMNDKC